MSKVNISRNLPSTRKHLVEYSYFGDYDKKVKLGEFDISIKLKKSPITLLEAPPENHPETGEKLDENVKKDIQETLSNIDSWELCENDKVLPVNFENLLFLFENYRPTYNDIIQVINATINGYGRESILIGEARQRELYLKNSKD